MNTQTTLKSKATIMLQHPCHFFAQGLGTGLSPIMPGTVGTLFGWLCFVCTFLFVVFAQR